jgi:hypothetical protein
MQKIELKTGTLELELDDKLKQLVEFGSRNNKKRGFLFVSRVLGKHLPTKPSVMKECYRELSAVLQREIARDSYTIFIGFAETATALGQGVFEMMDMPNSFYIHSTRFKTSRDVMLNFYEEHCHAPSHIFYRPDEFMDIVERAENVVLIDDEVSTGNTANNLVKELKKVLKAKNYYLLTILNWAKKDYSEFKYLYLYRGDFQFTNREFELEKSKSITDNSQNLDEIIPYNFGRYGVKRLKREFKVDLDTLRDKKVLVIGTAEFMYYPYLFAEYLQENSIDVYYQATTRSPINIDGIIESKISFKDNYFEDIDNFLYNIGEYDKIFICYETTEIPANHDLKRLLKCDDIEEMMFKE